MIADRLRAAILQAAISGKLTDQRPEDGTATELLEQIKAKRAALVKAKKLKKQKLLPRVNVDDQAFVLPASWSWISFGETISLFHPSRMKIGHSRYLPIGYGRGSGRPRGMRNEANPQRMPMSPRIWRSLRSVCAGQDSTLRWHARMRPRRSLRFHRIGF